MATAITTWLASSSHGAVISPTAPPAAEAGAGAVWSLNRPTRRPTQCVGPGMRAVMGGTLVRRGQREDGGCQEHEGQQQAESGIDPRVRRRCHRHRSGTRSSGKHVHQDHRKAHRGVNEIVREVDPERDLRLEALDDEPHEQGREDELPDRPRAEGPAGNEHAGHGHPHEDVGDVDVPTCIPASCDGHQRALRAHRRPRPASPMQRSNTARRGWPSWEASRLSRFGRRTGRHAGGGSSSHRQRPVDHRQDDDQWS